MSWGLKYQSQFTTQSDTISGQPEKDFTLQFLFKDYSGGVTSVPGGDFTVTHNWGTDDPVAPIKGSSLSIQLLNLGNIPISVFQSEDDDGVQVKLIDDQGNIRFIGFLVQDDFYEGMVDYGHPITLSANDSLGLLKGVILSESQVRRSFEATYQTKIGFDSVVYLRVTDTAFYPQAGNTIEINGVSYVIATAVQEETFIVPVADPFNWTVTLTTPTPGLALLTDTVYLTGEVNLLNRNSLLSIIAVCLASTNLALITNIFFNYYPYQQSTSISSLDQTLLDSQLFISGETYDDCYTALTKILTALNCTLFQANGQWNIVNWYESRRYTDNAINGFVYDETWTFAGTTTFTNNFFVGPDPQLTRPIHQLTQGSIRGYKFTRRQFDYRTPKYLLRNYDLLDLGPLRATYVSGGNTYSEYEAPGWLNTFGSPAVDRFIRVIVDNSTQAEIERYLILRGATFDSARCLPSVPFECNEKDTIKFSCDFRTNISQPSPVGFPWAIQLNDGVTPLYIQNDQTWDNTVGYQYVLPTGDNTNTWHGVEIQSNQMPHSGSGTVYLPQFTANPQSSSKECHFKNIRLEYIFYVADSIKVIGQIHKTEQVANKKNNSNIEILIDDSPRNQIIGTTFLTTVTNLLQDRTTFWRHPTDGIFGWRLGELTTLDELTWRQKTRSKLDGGFTGMFQNNYVSMLTMFITDFDTNKNYVPGMMTIDYKRNQFSASLWEIHSLADGTFTPDYSFTYIYSTT